MPISRLVQHGVRYKMPGVCGETHLVDCLKRKPKCSLAKPRYREIGTPKQVRVTRDEFNRFFVLSATSTFSCALRSDIPSVAKNIAQDLDIEHPVARIMKDKDRSNSSGRLEWGP